MPAGVDTGSTLRLTGRGAVGPRGGAAGDLYVHLRVAPHERFARDGDDLVTALPISIAQAALGTHLALPTLDGDEELRRAGRHPAGPRVRAHGTRACPACRAAAAATCARRSCVEVPTKLTDAEDEAAAQARRVARRVGRRARQGPLLADQVGVPVARMDDGAAPLGRPRLRRRPRRAGARRRRRATTSAACCACATGRRSPSPTGAARGARARCAAAPSRSTRRRSRRPAGRRR